MSSRSVLLAVAVGALALCAAACERRSSAVTAAQEGVAVALPASELEARVPARASAFSSDAGAPPRPVGRKPVPVLYRGESTHFSYALAAPPSADHPKGTLAVLNSDFVPDKRVMGEGTYDVSVVEVDLGTATPIRSIPLAHGVDRYDMVEATQGALVELQSRGELSLAWLDGSLAVRAMRSIPDLRSGKGDLCAFAAVGDRAVFAECASKTSRTRVWIFDDRGRQIARLSCPGMGTELSLQVSAWKDRAVLTGTTTGADDTSRRTVCAFPVDGSPGMMTRSFPLEQQVFAANGGLFVEASDYGDGSSGTYALGDDMRRTGLPLPERRPPEVIAAERLGGYASSLRARLVEGLIVLQAIHCCGEDGPGLYIFDPHANHE